MTGPKGPSRLPGMYPLRSRGGLRASRGLVPGSAPDSDGGAAPPPRSGHRSLRGLATWAFAAALVLAVGLGAWRAMLSGDSSETASEGRGGAELAPVSPAGAALSAAGELRPSVAVLPFANLSGDSASSFFVSGVHESVLVTLSKIRALDVSALQAVRPYAGTERSLREVADDLDVTSILTGSVQRDLDRVRIIVGLVDPISGNQLWSEAYDRRLDDIFGVQAEIARAVADSLRAVLTPDEEERIRGRSTENIEALDGYMRGREAYQRLTPGSIEEAIRHFEAATRADSSFAPAWTGIADALLQRVQFSGYPLVWADSAMVLVERATRLDPNLPEAYKTLGFIHSVYGRQQASLEANQRALELRPAFESALNNAGWSHYALGDLVEAERLIRRSFRLRPTTPLVRSNVGAIWVALGRLDEGEEWLDAVLAADSAIVATRNWRVHLDLERMQPELALERAEAFLVDEDGPTAHARAAFAALLAGRLADARAFAETALAAGSDANLVDLRRMETLLGYTLIQEGSLREGEEAARAAIASVSRAIANGADGWDPPWELAAAYAALGDAPEAMRHLDRAVALGYPHAAILRLDPTFDLLRGDPSFDDLVTRVDERTAEQRERSSAAR